MQDNSKTRVDYKAKVIDYVTVTIFLGMTIAAIMQVVFRFIMQISVPWTEELARIFYVYVIFLGTILIESENNQIKTTFLIDKLPYKPRFIVQVFLNVFSIVFLICLFIGAIFMFRSSATLNFGSMVFLPVSILYIPVMICCPFTIWYLFRQLLHFTAPKDMATELRETIQKETASQEGDNK